MIKSLVNIRIGQIGGLASEFLHLRCELGGRPYVVEGPVALNRLVALREQVRQPFDLSFLVFLAPAEIVQPVPALLLQLLHLRFKLSLIVLLHAFLVLHELPSLPVSDLLDLALLEQVLQVQLLHFFLLPEQLIKQSLLQLLHTFTQYSKFLLVLPLNFIFGCLQDFQEICYLPVVVVFPLLLKCSDRFFENAVLSLKGFNTPPIQLTQFLKYHPLCVSDKFGDRH